jgi:hypothetical protein
MKQLLYKISFMAVFLFGFVPRVGATDANLQSGADAAHSGSTPSSLFSDTKNADGSVTQSAFHNIADTLIYIVGAVAVLMLIIGGLRYVTSQGSSDGVKQAKDTILYGIIGVVVAILAYAVVSFVASSLT